MGEDKIGLAQLKSLAMGFDRAQMRDVHIVKDGEDYLSKRTYGCMERRSERAGLYSS